VSTYATPRPVGTPKLPARAAYTQAVTTPLGSRGIVEQTLWFIIAGAIFVLMALSVTRLKKIQLTSSILYLLTGVGVGPLGLGLLRMDALTQSSLLLRVAEIALLISLFTAGLKLRLPLLSRRWKIPMALATASMVLGIALLTLAGHLALGLPIGAAILLAALLAPTDPVLASDVQVEGPADRDTVRLALTGEAGLNDGAAFPFVMLGLGLLELHDLGTWGWRWIAVDLVWAIGAGLGIGWGMGFGVGRVVLYLRREHQEAVGLDAFLALGLMALSYGVALLLHAYGFLAVFAAGLALRGVERVASNASEPMKNLAIGADEATDRQHAPAFMAHAILQFNEQLERIGEVVVVILVGALLSTASWVLGDLWIVPLLLLIIRPLCVAPILTALHMPRHDRILVSWFGIRGIGSIYYLMYAIDLGVDPLLAERMIAITLSVVAASIVVHGLTATPLMRVHQRRLERRPIRVGQASRTN